MACSAHQANPSRSLWVLGCVEVSQPLVPLFSLCCSFLVLLFLCSLLQVCLVRLISFPLDIYWEVICLLRLLEYESSTHASPPYRSVWNLYAHVDIPPLSLLWNIEHRS